MNDNINCCFLAEALEHVAAAIYSQIEDKVKNEIGIEKEEEAFQVGAQQATLMLVAILNAEGKLCSKCSDFEKQIGEEKLIKLVNEYTESYKKSKQSHE